MAHLAIRPASSWSGWSCVCLRRYASMYLATSRPKHAQHQLVIFSPGRQAGGRAGRQARSHLHHPKSKPETNEMGEKEYVTRTMLEICWVLMILFFSKHCVTGRYKFFNKTIQHLFRPAIGSLKYRICISHEPPKKCKKKLKFVGKKKRKAAKILLPG